ncbi:MAG TPA: phenylacetate--CoA ligase family protein [Polyangia bacterium]|nr:phenylacetate--CoA ligase family protein [Polyangia bacterium]
MIHPVHWYRLWRLGTMAKLRRLRDIQWAPAAEVERMQHQRLGDLLRHAHDHVPYYREVLERCGVVDSSGGVDLTAFATVPFLDKDIIRSRSEDLLSDDLDQRPWFRNYSGGSTGEPVAFVQEQREDSHWSRAVTLLFDEWSGRGPGDRCALLWGSERDLAGAPSWRVRYRRRTRRILVLNAFGMTPEHMGEYVKDLNRFRPRQILAYAGSLYELARFIRDGGLSVWSPAGIMTSAESIYPEQRALIESVFRAPVFDRYGSREAGNMACECDHHRGLHVSTPTHLIELLRPDGTLAGPGESGEIVVTCFETFAMPLIRYRIGDLATWAEGPCDCGRAWPLLRQVNGRVMDAFETPGGGTIDGCYFTMGFFGHDWVKKFQVVQETAQTLRVFIVLLDPATPRERIERDLAHYDEHARTVLGPACRVEYEFVDAITPTPQGKHRYTISKLSTQDAGCRRQTEDRP